MTPPRRGCLLVAAPTLADPNFFRTVVLLLAYDDDGALGVILNRPSDTPISEIVPSWALHASPPGVLFSGGPVQPNAAICVGHHVNEGAGSDLEALDALEAMETLRAFEDLSGLAGLRDLSAEGLADESDDGGESDGGDDDDSDDDDDDDYFGGYSPLTSMIGTVDLHREPEDIAVTFAGLRVFKGYSGWGPGQLDEEIEEQAWYVVEGYPADILTSEPEDLWERVLKQQGGWLSVLSRHPVDPSLN
ncbi:MAG: YqgE/AlgH family protein [Acidimicrobiales bacterium]